MSNPPDRRLGKRDGLRYTITWLHRRAEAMNDPHAKAVLNSAAFSLGCEIREGHIPPIPELSSSTPQRAADASTPEAMKTAYAWLSLPLSLRSVGNLARALDAFAQARVEAAAEKERPSKFLAWAVEMFGPVALERRERALRFVEEAIELSHATGIDAATLTIVIERVYSRPAGDTTNEAAQALACLECLALVLDINLETEANAELARVRAIPRQEWTRRHAAKVALGFAGESP